MRHTIDPDALFWLRKNDFPNGRAVKLTVGKQRLFPAITIHIALPKRFTRRGHIPSDTIGIKKRRLIFFSQPLRDRTLSAGDSAGQSDDVHLNSPLFTPRLPSTRTFLLAPRAKVAPPPADDNPLNRRTAARAIFSRPLINL